MNPPPGTHAFPVWTGGHVGGDFKDCVAVPNAFVLDGKDGKVFWADFVGVVSVGDGKRAAGKIVMASSVEV